MHINSYQPVQSIYLSIWPPCEENLIVVSMQSPSARLFSEPSGGHVATGQVLGQDVYFPDGRNLSPNLGENIYKHCRSDELQWRLIRTQTAWK